VLWIASLNDGDGLMRPKLVYEWQDNVKTWLGADIFYGGRDGLFGQFSDNDRIVIGVEPGYQDVKDDDCILFLQDVLPRLRLRWPGFRKVRRQVCKRIQRRIVLLGLSDVQAYRSWLDTHPDEWQVLDAFCQITISRFYRDKHVFQCLETDVIPHIVQRMQRDGEQALTVWSAGCGSGEEPYTLALLWAFSLAPMFPEIKLDILASDANADMIHRTREACYSASSLGELPGRWREVAFSGSGNRFCLQESYRKGVEILYHDIRSGAPNGPFHLVLCRNLVFTYFDEKLQCETGRYLSNSVREGGSLVTGAHEQLPDCMAGFEPWDGCRSIYCKKG
jgi:chemotaxis protein methyltransferase CheR